LKKAFVLAMTIAFVAALGFAAEDWRGDNRLAGFVIDKTTGKPVPNATVKLRIQKGSKGGPDTKTDANGKWAFLGLGVGMWNMDVEAANYVVRQLGNIAIAEGARIPPMKIEIEPEVRQEVAATATEPPHEEVRVGGQVVAKEVADAIEAGNAALNAKNFKEAVTNYEKASQAMPTFTPIKLALARAYYGANQLAKAIAAMQQVYTADIANAQNGLLLANMLLENGQIKEAEEILNKLPEGTLNMDTLLNTGIAMMNKKQPGSAVSYFTRAIQMDPKSHLGYYYRGLAYIQNGKTKEAKPDLQKVIELAPTSQEATEAKEYLKSIK